MSGFGSHQPISFGLTPPCFSRVANKGGVKPKIGRRRRKFFGIFRSFAVGNRPETIDFEQKSCSAVLYFKNFSPAALSKPPRSFILVKSPPQAKIFLGLRPTFWFNPPLVSPGSRTRGGLNQRIWVDHSNPWLISQNSARTSISGSDRSPNFE